MEAVDVCGVILQLWIEVAYREQLTDGSLVTDENTADAFIPCTLTYSPNLSNSVNGCPGI
jgi:hypothetical protein